MIYREITPSKPLRDIINCFWMIRSSRPQTLRDRTLPDGCQEVVFNVSSEVHRDDGRGFTRNPSVELIGQMTRPYEVMTRGHPCFFGIKFFPHSFSRLCPVSTADLRDQSINLLELFPPDFEAVVTEVMERADFQYFVLQIEAYLQRRMALGPAPGKGYALVEHAVRSLFARESTRIDHLADSMGVSKRHLQQSFKAHVGLTPKQFWKMLRFQRSFRYLSNRGLSLTDIAHRCHYYDQAHFAHDFRTFSGACPSDYRLRQTPLNGFFLDEQSRAYLCNLG